MKICEEGHDTKYVVTYLPAKGTRNFPEWFVCESCMANKRCFSSEQEIVSVRILA